MINEWEREMKDLEVWGQTRIQLKFRGSRKAFRKKQHLGLARRQKRFNTLTISLSKETAQKEEVEIQGMLKQF